MARNEDIWTAEVRRQAYVAIGVASESHAAAHRTLGYYVRSAMAHGLSLDQVCEAGNLNPATVRELSDPATAS